MSIRDSEYFIYDGIRSNDRGIMNVNVNTGMLEENFAYKRDIQEVDIRGRRPYFQEIKKAPLVFTVSFAFEEDWGDRNHIRDIARWLTGQEYYKPLIFSGDPERIFYAVVIESPTLVHNGLKQGYVNLTFRCNDSYAYSPIYHSKVYDWDEVPVILNRSDFSSGGNIHNLSMNASNQLVLNAVKTKWSSIANKKWNELQ